MSAWRKSSPSQRGLQWKKVRTHLGGLATPSKEEFGVHSLLFYLMTFGIYSAFTFLIHFVIPGDSCVPCTQLAGP